jgi:hypothetical protein
MTKAAFRSKSVRKVTISITAARLKHLTTAYPDRCSEAANPPGAFQLKQIH